MALSKQAKFLLAYDEVGGGSRSYFFELSADALIAKSEAREKIEWPPRLITQDEVVLLEAISTLTENEVILFKSLLVLVREKSKKKQAKSKKKSS